MKLKGEFPGDARARVLREAEARMIAETIDSGLGTSISMDGDYSIACRSPGVQRSPHLVAVLKDLLGKVTHPSHVQWIVRCLPLNQTFDASFLETHLHKVEHQTVLHG